MISSEAFLAFVGVSALIVVLLACVYAGWTWMQRTAVRTVLLTAWIVAVVLWISVVAYGLHWARGQS